MSQQVLQHNYSRGKNKLVSRCSWTGSRWVVSHRRSDLLPRKVPSSHCPTFPKYYWTKQLTWVYSKSYQIQENLLSIPVSTIFHKLFYSSVSQISFCCPRCSSFLTQKSVSKPLPQLLSYHCMANLPSVHIVQPKFLAPLSPRTARKSPLRHGASRSMKSKNSRFWQQLLRMSWKYERFFILQRDDNFVISLEKKGSTKNLATNKEDKHS